MGMTMINRPRVESMAGVAFKTRRIERHAARMRDEKAAIIRRRAALSAGQRRRRYRETPYGIGLAHGAELISSTGYDFGNEPGPWLEYYRGWKEGKERRNGQQG